LVVYKSVQHPETEYVKRLVAIAGDEIQIKDNVIYLNGSAVVQQKVGDKNTKF